MSGYYGIDQHTTLHGEPRIGDLLVILKSDHIKEVKRASETYYQQYIDALWQVSYLSEKIYYLEKEIADLKGQTSELS